MKLHPQEHTGSYHPPFASQRNKREGGPKGLLLPHVRFPWPGTSLGSRQGNLPFLKVKNYDSTEKIFFCYWFCLFFQKEDKNIMKAVTIANHKLSTILMFSESKVTDSVFILCFIIQTCVLSSSPSTGYFQIV